MLGTHTKSTVQYNGAEDAQGALGKGEVQKAQSKDGRSSKGSAWSKSGKKEGKKGSKKG